ncbi:putative cullin 3 [Besnoitia besnoiti]|uniref:Putative cullin 3 n=1 Tax=Besnoitia besnoiti TaxID=94643 RepID=A0A2A9MBJ5_BESBE|nr:putative cullin 3 [Besnoitia besnoiti]PFH32762.1 putative cullin 3 [Besnoitia besnoiti]
MRSLASSSGGGAARPSRPFSSETPEFGLFGHKAMSGDEVARRWEFLRTAFEHIFAHEAGTLSYEEVYRYAYMLVINKKGKLLYDGTRQCVEAYLGQVAAAVAEQENDDLFLSALLERWRDHRTNMQMVKDVLLYLDKHYVEMHHLTPSFSMGMNLFCTTVLQHPHIQLRFRHLLLNKITREREGQQVDRMMMREAISMLSQLRLHVHRQVYKEEFETPFLAATREFYVREASDYIVYNATPDYLVKAETRINEEAKRVEDYLDADTAAPLRALMEDVWLGQHYKTLVYNPNSGCAHLFHSDKIGDLARMHRLFSAVPGALEEVRQVMKDSITKYGEAIVSDPEKTRDPVTFVQSFFLLKSKFDQIVIRAFGESKEAFGAQMAAFETVLNKDTRAARFLSLYLDDMFRKTMRGLSDVEAEQKLEEVLVLFRYLRDKDIFEAVYKQHLARRLLAGRSACEEEEKKMITKLKAECGQQYTSKLEGMYRDMQASDDIMRQYHARDEYERDLLSAFSLCVSCAFACREVTVPALSRLDACLRDLGEALGRREGSDAVPVSPPVAVAALPESTPPACVSSLGGAAACDDEQSGDFEFSVRVVTQGTWPVDLHSLVAETQLLPASLLKEAKLFESFYLSRHNGRVLKWNLGQGKAVVRGHLRYSRHDFDCTTLQMLFLLAFNFFPDGTPVSVSELLNCFLTVAPALPLSELKRHLTSLTTPRCRILLRAAAGDSPSSAQELKDSDTLTVNLPYMNKLRRVRVPLIALTAAAGEAGDWSTPQLETQAGADVPSSVEQDRNYLVEAAIVRVMKTRRRLSHNDLLVEVTRHLAQRFRPSPALIKQRIEKLIEREFLDRDAADRRIYNYLA